MKKSIFLCCLGSFLESFEYASFALLIPYISKFFFPHESTTYAYFNSFLVFAVSYLVRPFGGGLLGYLGDRFGRRNALLLTVLLMSIAGFCMSVIPGYQTLGIMAPILLILLRILQGLAVCGEAPAALVYVYEIYPQRKNLLSGIICTSFIIGALCASGVIALLQFELGTTLMLAWGWRIPFFIGAVLAVIVLIARVSLIETPVFTSTRSYKLFFRNRILNAKRIIQGIVLTGYMSLNMIVLFYFMPSYLAWLHYPKLVVQLGLTVTLIFAALLGMVLSWLTENIDTKKYFLYCYTFVMIISVLIFKFYMSHQLILALSLTTLCIASTIAVFPTALSNLFPSEIRLTGVGLSYNIAFALFGGITPALIMLLIHSTHNYMMPGYYLFIMLLLNLSIFLLLTKRGERSVNEITYT